MREIPLNHGKVTLIDDEDYELVAAIPWTYRWQYAVSNDLSMHRVILGLEKHDPRVVHHINGNGLDNRRANLQIFPENSAHLAHHHKLRREQNTP